MRGTNKLPWFKFNVDKFLSETAHLNTNEVGAYTLLLCWYWKNGPLPNDRLTIGRISKLPINCRGKIVDRLLKDLFEERRSHMDTSHEVSMWHNVMMDDALAQAIEISKANSAKAHLRHSHSNAAAPQTLDIRKRIKKEAPPESLLVNNRPSAENVQPRAPLGKNSLLSEPEIQEYESRYPALENIRGRLQHLCNEWVQKERAKGNMQSDQEAKDAIKNTIEKAQRKLSDAAEKDSRDAERQRQVEAQRKLDEMRATRAAYLERRAARLNGPVH